MIDNCEHEWVVGPFFISAADSYEEPTYYPPSALVRLDHCIKCGLIRLPKEMRHHVANLNRRQPAYSTLDPTKET